MISVDYEKSLEDGRKMLAELYKTCGRCIHEDESAEIIGSACYLCSRNPVDNRIDCFERRK